MRAIVGVVVRYGSSCVVALHRIYIVMRSLHALARLYYSYIIWVELKETLFIGLRGNRCILQITHMDEAGFMGL